MTDKLPTQHNLIPNLGVLDRLIMESSREGTYSKTQRETEQLPYYLRGVCFSLNELERCRVDAATALSEFPVVTKDAQLILPPETFDPLSFSVDSCFFFLRRVMDSVITYLSRCPRTLSLPSSMSVLMKSVKKGKCQLDSQIIGILKDYWNDVGRKIKGYRDQINHKAIILSNCIVFSTSKGVGLKMLLPDNPEETSPFKIKYTPGINAMGFLLDALKLTIQFVNALVERMIDLMAEEGVNPREKAIVGLTMRGGPLVLSAKRSGEPVPYPIGVSRVVEMAFE